MNHFLIAQHPLSNPSSPNHPKSKFLPVLQVATITATEVPSYHFDPHPAIHIILGYQWIKMTTWNLTETATGSIQGLAGEWFFFSRHIATLIQDPPKLFTTKKMSCSVERVDMVLHKWFPRNGHTKPGSLGVE